MRTAELYLSTVVILCDDFPGPVALCYGVSSYGGGVRTTPEEPMGTPLTPDTLIRILRAEGVKVAEYPGWRSNERDDETGKPFGPVYLLLNHHTAGTSSLGVVARGRAGLPGPLAHAHLNKGGVVTLVSAGRANHAGLMAKNAYDSFRDEHERHPAPDASSGTVDGNDVSYGLETENLGNGTDVYPEVQYDAMVRWNAALCRHYRWSADSVACHRETSIEGKVDPKGPVAGYGTRGRFTFVPAILRQDVAERLRHTPSWSPPQTAEEPPVATDPQVFKDVVLTDSIPVDAGGDDDWSLARYQQDTRFQLQQAHRKLDLILDHLGLDGS